MAEMTEEEKEFEKHLEALRQHLSKLIQSGKAALYKGLEFHLLEDGKFSIHATEDFKNTYRNTFELTSADSSLECFEIPKEIDGKPVTTINSTVFAVCPKNLKSIIIPDSVTNIATECFAWLLKENVTTTIDSNNPAYMINNGGLYTKDGKTLLKAASKQSVFTIIDGVTTIAVNALLGYHNLSGLVISSSVKRIERAILTSGTCKNIFYKGTKADWGNISIDDTNDYDFKKLTVYFYSETPSGNSWHYAKDGTPEITHTSLLSKLFKK